jgi:hypothetical protein
MKIKYQLSHIMALLIIASGLSAINVGTSSATAYMLSEGIHRYTTGLQYSTADDWFNEQRDRVPQGCRSKDYYWHNQYTYGYSYYFNLFAAAAVGNYECGLHTKVAGVADIKLGIRGRLDLNRNGRTWELALLIPTGYDSQKVNRLGYGRLGFWGGLAWSSQNTGWEEKEPSYWEVGAGITYWSGSPSTQSRTYGKYSWRLDEDGNNRIVVQGTLKLSLRDGRATFPAAFAGFPRFSGDYDSFTVSAKYAHRLTRHWSISPRIGSTVWGRNTSANNFVDLSITRQWGD